MITSKLILPIICLINLQKNFVKGQAISVAVTSANGYSSTAASSPLAGISYGIPSLLNSFYRPLEGFLNGLSTYQQQIFPANTITNDPNIYYFNNQENVNGHLQYQQTHFSGYDDYYKRPHQPFGQWTGDNRNSNYRQPNHNNFPKNPYSNQNVGINGVSNNRQHRLPVSNSVPSETQTNFNRSPLSGEQIPLIRPQNPTWNTQTSYPNYIRNSLNTKPDIIKSLRPWSSTQQSIIREPDSNNFQDGLISEIVDDPLNIKNTRDSLISQPAGNPGFKPNYNQNPSSTKPNINKFPMPPPPWSSSQSSLISEPAADPLKVNNFQNSLISEIVDDPLKVKNPQNSLISQPAANPLFKPDYQLPNNNKFPIFSTSRPSYPEKLKPGIIINPDSPQYIDANSNDPSLFIDIRSN